jgi:putative ABC transport system substrate-binding protein
MAFHIDRRQLISAIGGASVAWPLAARAQQPAMPVVGFLHFGSPNPYAQIVAAFQKGLADNGFIEGQNVAIEYRWAENHDDRLSALAAELVSRQPAVIAAGTTPGALAAKRATATIPIVFSTPGDPVELGLVESLNRPGGNATGVARLSVEISPKLLEVLHEIVPKAEVIGFLVNPANTNALALTKNVETAAVAFGQKLVTVKASTDGEIDAAFATLVKQRAGAVVVPNDALFVSQVKQLVALAAQHAIPAVYSYREAVMAGGLMSYGAELTDAYRQVGDYVGRILKGAKPADLPVQQSTKIELVINMKAAKALGLTFPLSLLGRADEVIE